MDYQKFAEIVTPTMFKGSLPSFQAEPLERIIREGIRRSRSLQDCAYVLATGYHETSRWRYTHEIGEGRGRDYGEPILLIRGHTVAYYGRSDVQLTWLRNYAKMSVALTLELGREIDLVSNPDLATQPEYSSYIIWQGMINGMFTGKGLADYISTSNPDYVGARKIVNGTDKDELIASYARQFETALEDAGYTPSPATPVDGPAGGGFIDRLFGQRGD